MCLNKLPSNAQETRLFFCSQKMTFKENFLLTKPHRRPILRAKGGGAQTCMCTLLCRSAYWGDSCIALRRGLLFLGAHCLYQPEVLKCPIQRVSVFPSKPNPDTTGKGKENHRSKETQKKTYKKLKNKQTRSTCSRDPCYTCNLKLRINPYTTKNTCCIS